MDSIGMGGRFAPESVDELDRNMHLPIVIKPNLAKWPQVMARTGRTRRGPWIPSIPVSAPGNEIPCWLSCLQAPLPSRARFPEARGYTSGQGTNPAVTRGESARAAPVIDAGPKREKKAGKHKKTPIKKDKTGITDHIKALRVEVGVVTWEYNTVMVGGGVRSIADTQHERRLLQQMLVDACGNDSMPDIGALLVKLVVKDRAFAKYGAGAAVAVGEMTVRFSRDGKRSRISWSGSPRWQNR